MAVHKVDASQLYRCRLGDRRTHLMLPGPTSDTRLLIWACERHWKQVWPVDQEKGFYEGPYSATWVKGMVKSVDYTPPSGVKLEITRADVPLTFRKEVNADWADIGVVVIQ